MEESGPAQPQDSTVEAPPLTRGIDFTPSEDEERPAKVPRTEKPVPAANRPQILRSVVKVFVKRSLPNYAQPWQTQQQRSAVGSAFVIDTENRHILTNSHVVAHHITIHVRRPGHPKKWKASQLCEGKACDLALMTVEEDEFWEGIQAVKFLGVPELQQQITVTGYPIGGDSLSITQGIVSRVTMSPYTSGAAQLINIQIDAAINPGNSGGPAFANLSSSEVVGVAFSRHKQAEATGYIIPYIVVQHFMESFKRRGLFSGLCCLGILVNRLENPSLRRYHQLSKEQSGAVIKKISPLASATAVLSVDDVITHVNDQPVADDCTLTLRHDERISMMHAIRASHIGDEVHLDILRAGTPSRVSYPLNHCLYKIPGLHGVDCWPSYYIYGGMVFQPLSQPLLEHYYGRHVGSKAPPSLLAELSQFREHVDESIVVLSQVLAADVTFGYHCQFGRLNSVNGVDIMNIYQLADVCDNCTSEFVIFDLHPNDQVVLGREEVEATLPAVLEAHGIAEDRSKDVRDRSVLPRQAHGILAGTADLVEKSPNVATNTNAANAAPDAAAAGAGASGHAANCSAAPGTSGAGSSAGTGGNGGNGGDPNGSGAGATAPDSEMKECGASEAGEGS